MPILRKKWYFLFPNIVSLRYQPFSEDETLGKNLFLLSELYLQCHNVSIKTSTVQFFMFLFKVTFLCKIFPDASPTCKLALLS